MRLLKPSASLVIEFKAVVAELSRATPRKMFGYDAAFVNGNMAVGLWQNTCVLKLSKPHQEELLESGRAKPFAPNPGRTMSGWVELDEELANAPEELLEWCRRAVDYTATLPPKQSKPKVTTPGASKPKTKVTTPSKSKTRAPARATGKGAVKLSGQKRPAKKNAVTSQKRRARK